MPQYYFDIVTYSPGDKPDPEKDTIISIQYQKIDFRSGKPLQDMVVLKEWESSEEAIITRFFDKFFRGGQNKWIFIPVGYDLNAIWEMITLKFEEYLGPHFRNKRFHYTIPSVDLLPVVVLLNGGNFIGANLEKFTKQTPYKKHISDWYVAGEYAKIEENIQSSSKAFLTFYAKVKKNSPVILEDRKPPVKPVPKPVSVPKPEPAPQSDPEPEPVVEEEPEPEAVVEEEPPAPESPPEEKTPAPFMKEPSVNLPPPPPPPPSNLPLPTPSLPTPSASAPSLPRPFVPNLPKPKMKDDEPEEVHEEIDVHEHEVEEIGEDDLAAAEFAPEAHEVEVHEEAHEVEEGEEHEVVAVEAVEAHEIEGEVVEAEVHEAVEAVEEHVEALSPKELKKRKKEEAKRLKLEEKLRKKQQKMK